MSSEPSGVTALVACLLLLVHSAAAQTGAIAGRAVDAANRTPISGVRVNASAGDRVAGRAVTGADGLFRLERLPPDTYAVSATRIGYGPGLVNAVTVRAGETATVALELKAHAITLDAAIVTASRREEKVLEAPAAVSVIGREEVAAQPSLTPADRVAQLPGVDVVTSGLTQHNVVTRGFNNAGSGQLLVLTDNRYAAVPSLRINAYNFIPLTDDDIDRIEVVRGPGAALYGPNTTAGVMHLISRSPFDSRGTTVTLSGGARRLVQVAARHAGVVGSRLGWKLSGQYFRADDFGYLDPEEQTSRDAALRAGASPDTLRIGKRDSLIERVAGEARVDLRAGSLTTVIGSVGFNQAINNLDVTGFGAAQVHGWRYQYAQVRLVRPDLFAQAFYNGSDAGDTYLLGTGLRVADRSSLLVGQLQQVIRPVAGEAVTWGVDAQRTVPRTGGTIFGRYEADDVTDEAGGYVHSATQLRRVDLIAALRLDYHSRVSGIALSPRAAVVLRPAEGHSLRFTYNRAFNTPTSYDLFLDLPVATLRDEVTGITLPYLVRAMGVPGSGFTFRRDCGSALGGLCMRSPYAPASLGGPQQYLPPDATQLWSVLVDSLKTYGFDLSGIPQPSAAQVASGLGRLNIGTRKFQAVAPEDVTDLGALGHRTTSTLELGYKGLVGRDLLGTVDLYYSWYHGFSDQYVVTPNVFFDAGTLRTYLAQFMPPARADTVAALVSSIPAGTIAPEQAFDPSDILVASHHFGRVSLWGLDASVAFQASERIALAGTYSWVDRNLFPNVDGIADIALNAPRHKGSLRASYRGMANGIAATVTGRYVGGFRVISGVFNGQVQPYSVLDAEVSWRLPFSQRTSLRLAGWGLAQAQRDALGGGWRLTSRHREFVRVPALGRLLVAGVRVEL